MIRYLLPVILLSALCCGTASAQIAQPVGADSLSHTILPMVGYSSDAGLMGGVLFNRIDYRGETQPYRNYLESSAIFSTKGYVQVDAMYERTRSFNRKIRSTVELFIDRIATDTFFGVGNDTEFTDQRWEEEYYYFEAIGFGVEYLARKPLYQRENAQLDLTAGLGTEYNIGYETGEETRFAQFRPNGDEGGWVNFLSTGFIWENRDSEFDPHRGNRIDLEIRHAPHLLSEFDFTTARLEYRQYFHLFDFITVANRLEGRHAGGDVPYWELSMLGDEYNLRGYPLNRFQGRSSLLYTLELRSWLVEFPLYHLRIGGQLFTDMGRVFTAEDQFDDLFRGYHRTFGFGGALSVFNPDIILRGEVGFSEDMSRIYIGIGYTF